MRQRVGLVMVVKNEAHVLRRCLESVRGLIDHFTIVVDGSTTDDSVVVAADALSGIVGEFYHRPWVNFSTNRNEANELAAPHSDYLLTIDADDYVVGALVMPLTADAYTIDIHEGEYGSETVYPCLFIFKANAGFRFVGAAHERLIGPKSIERLGGIYQQRTTDGASWKDPHAKHTHYAQLLEAELLADPTDTHACFYAAKSWRDAADSMGDGLVGMRALELYQRRVEMVGGERDEVFYSYLMLGKLHQRLGDWPAAKQAYFKAISVNPARAAEPRHDLVVMLHKDRYFTEAYDVGKLSLHDPLPTGLNVDTSIYRWRLELEWALAAWWAGHKDEAKTAWERLLTTAPPEEHERIRDHLTYC